MSFKRIYTRKKIASGVVLLAGLLLLLSGGRAFAQLSPEDIEALQEKGLQEGWTFSISANDATSYPLSQLTGAIPHENLPVQIPFKKISLSKSLPDAFDWRDLNGCTPIKNQGSCGSCWAFGTTAALECNILIRDETVVDLSEQWLISCNPYGYSCDGGGFIHEMYLWMNDPCGETGAVLEEDFPYAAQDKPCECPYPHHYWIQDFFEVTQWGVPQSVNRDYIKQAIMDYGPVSCEVYASDAMQAYSGGVFNACEFDYINHIVALVGWDDNLGDSGVWIMRNSWGGNWGENGYCYISYGCNYIDNYVVAVDYRASQRIAFGGSEISDPEGDLDGIPEPGETIYVTAKVANAGPSPVYDVSVAMFTDDASLNILDDSAWFGTIMPADTNDNDGDPFRIEIPLDYVSRLDSFYFEITWNCGAGIDTIIIDTMAQMVTIGAISALLVDDDNGGRYDTIYTNTFENFRIPLNTWEAAGGSPDSAYLVDYDIVIWMIGGYRPAPLSGDEITALRGYLNAGGNLFLTGQGIAAQLNSEDPVFLNDYLRCSYLMTYRDPLLTGQSTGQIFNSEDVLALAGTGSVNNQTAPDHIQSENGGVLEMTYFAYPDNGAGVSYAGEYRLVFFALGFESLTQGDWRRTDRDTVFTRILDFFGYARPGLAPQVLQLLPLPDDPMHVTRHNPLISWDYSDPGENSQLQYHLQVDHDMDWSVIDKWDYGPTPSPDTAVTYGGLPLWDGELYGLRIRVNNGIFWSNWFYQYIRMNSIPTIPHDLNPSNMGAASTSRPYLSFTNADDANFDQLNYQIQIYEDEELTSLLVDQAGVAEQYGATTLWQVNIDLDDDAVYFWRVKASDGFESGGWSGSASFWVNSVNSEPAAFGLLQPVNNGGGSRTPLFIWSASADADPYDVVTYDLYYADNPTFYQSKEFHNLSDTQYQVSTAITGDVIYWKVIAGDLFSGSTTCNGNFVMYPYIRGDANNDGSINIGDMVFIGNFVFHNGPAPEVMSSGDANCDGSVNIGDAVYLGNHIFHDGLPPQCQ